MADAADQTIALAGGRLIALLERHLPHRIASLHLVGSAALGDFQPGRSDLDFVAVLARPATDDEIEALVILHRIYGSDPTLPALDGIWVTAAELAAGPEECADGPTSHDGNFLRQARGNRNPVTWAMLRQQRVTLVGELDPSTLWDDPSRLVSWMLENTESYWVPWHARASRLMSPEGLAMLGGGAIAWGVLGICRLYYTLSSGVVASKTAAGEHALNIFDAGSHRIVAEALRLRRGQGGANYANPFERRRDALRFIAMAIDAIRAYRASE